ncbi:MAG TPA: oligopeptide/dipeptide ABC transporter ATP-binding protein [Jatrophihabitans sp.]|nr:oligopeptide/dipeptide ABC transporter ATP-binding protein [Jatrophihabitans sp.]
MTAVIDPAAPASTGDEPVVQVRELTVRYGGRGLFNRAGITAARRVSFNIESGRTLGIAGESGSGKSTVARAITRVIDSHAGQVLVAGHDVRALRGRGLRRFRRHMQMVFQDPYDSLNSRLTAGQNVAEGLVAAGGRRPDHTLRVRELFDRVGLPVSFTDRYPHQLSGGQRQRVSIARALAVNPQVLVCDEAVSALDVSIRAQILNLLKDLQERDGISLLFISHDLSTLRFIADEIAIMYFGQIVEVGPADVIFADPRHPYTQALIAAVPEPGARRRYPRSRLAGEAPSHHAPPPGCPFQPRCPLATEVCRQQDPALLPHRNGNRVACHHADDAVAVTAAPDAAAPASIEEDRS